MSEENIQDDMQSSIEEDQRSLSQSESEPFAKNEQQVDEQASPVTEEPYTAEKRLEELQSKPNEQLEEKEIVPSEHRQKKKPSVKKAQTEITFNEISKQLEKQTEQMNKIVQILQPLQKHMKSAQKESELINQIRSQTNLVKRRLGEKNSRKTFPTFFIKNFISNKI